MEQTLRQFLRRYHELLDGRRCSGWELEEFFVKSIKSDTVANHLPKWREVGHDDKEGILVIENDKEYQIQIKSGKFGCRRSDPQLKLSGHRLGRFNGNMSAITDYLNQRKAHYIVVPHPMLEDEDGRSHIYRIYYIDNHILKGIDSDNWIKHGKQYRNTNDYGVLFRLNPSMSWQIWWDIPISCLDMRPEFTNGQILRVS